MNFNVIFLERPYDVRLSEKHNGAALAASIADSAIGGLISLGAQNMTNIANAQSVRDTNTTNRIIADNYNAMQIAQAREARDWQEQMYERQLQGEKDQMYYQHLLNSPMTAVSEMRAAGINPSLGFGNTGQTGIASSGAPSASPSGVNGATATMQPAHYQTPQFPRMAASFSEIAQGIAALKAGDKSAAEANQISLLTEDLVRETRANARRAEIAAAIDESLAWDERNLKLQQVKQDIVKVTQEAANLAEENDLIKARTFLTRAQERAEVALSSLRGRERELRDLDIKTYFTRVNAQINALAASAEQSRATAANQRSQSLLTDEQRSQLQDMHDFNVRQKAALTQMSEAELRKTAVLLDSEIDYMLGHFEMLSEADKSELEKIKSQLKVQKNLENTWWFSYAFDKVERINNGITNWIPFAPDKEMSSRSEVYTDDGAGMRSRTVVHDSFRGKSFK